MITAQQQSRLAALSITKRKLFELMLKQQQPAVHQPFSLVDPADREKMPEQVEDAYPLGVVQLGMMFHMNKIRDTDTPPDYHNVSTFIFRFDEAFDLPLLQQAVDTLVAHEPMFRTAFDISNFKEPLQLVFKSAELAVNYVDLTDLSKEQQDSHLKDWIAKENFNVMALNVAPLVKLFVHQFSDTRIAFSLIEPHSISDGWSTHLNMIDIFNLYIATRDDSDYQLEPIHASYADFIRAEKAAIASPDSQSYWREVMQNVVITELPLKAPESGDTKLGEHRYDEYLPEDILAKLHQVVNTTGVPLKSVLLAAHARFLSLLSGQKHVTTGLNFNGRLETKGGINARGLFLNILPVTLSLEVDSWLELVKQAYQAEIAVLPHRNYPLGALQGSYGKRNLFDTAFSFLHFHSISNDPMAQSGKIECEEVIDYSKTNFDFNSVFNLHPTDATLLENKHDANLDRFSVAQLQGFFEFYLLILQDIGNNPEADPNRLDFLSPAKRDELVHRENYFDTHFDNAFDNAADNQLAKADGIHQWFEHQAVTSPDAVAVECAQTDHALSYRQLNARANQLAAALMAQNIAQGALVGLLMARSVDTLVAILAVLKTGAAFVPFEITQPVERANGIVEQSQIALVLGSGHKSAGLDANWMDIDGTLTGNWSHDNPDVAVTGETLCYVLYTSGSSGVPKGVMVPHRGVVNYVCWAKQMYAVEPGDCMPLYTSLAFDLTITTLFAPLISGARIRVYNASEASTLLLNIVEDNCTTLIKMTPAHLGLLKTIDISHWQANRLIVGGEQLSGALAREVVGKLPGQAKIYNEYGPTEASVGCMVHTFDLQRDTEAAVPIGIAAANVRIYVLDERAHPVLEGVKGELAIAGLGLAHGYLNEPALSAAAFVDDPFYPGEKMYRSGDLVRRLHDGNIEFIARVDNQTKISGYRIELGEIEALAGRHEMVDQVVMTVRQIAGSPQLVAYVVPAGADSNEAEVDQALRQLLIVQIKSHLKQYLPDYMVPDYFVFQNAFALNTNGKVDRDALPILEQYEVLTRSYQPPKNPVEKALYEIWISLLGRDQISVLDNFFDIGGTSILSFQLQVKIQEEAGYEVSVTDLFEYPTIRDLAKYINREQEQLADEAEDLMAGPALADEPIAVIGMAGRFPDALNINEFWQNLKDGHESLTWYSDEALLEAGVPEALVNHKDYVKVGVTLDNIRTFDAEFFGFTPRDAQLMDPQQRLLFEVAVETLDDGCYGDAAQSRNVGVFVGVGEGFYFINNLLTDPELLQTLGMEVQFGNGRDFAATRLSHRLNLTGPAMTVATACSTSLVAIHQACSSILRNECTMALAGGAKVGQFGARGHLYQEGGILSPDGHCRAFDADAKGTRSGDGCGMILLKRLSQAITDGDNIHALIKGSALNNDGIAKVGYTAPSVGGQVKVIRQALAKAQVSPQSIGYVEAHGTGTSLGDPIEVKGLKLAYNNGQSAVNIYDKCALGSVKSNIGHLDSAAGIASMVKTILALKHSQIPPSINFDQPNPAIEFDGSGFYVNTELRDWPQSDNLRRAGVSSFGIGGTNAHVIVEQAPPEASVPALAVMPAKHELVMVSARSVAALAQVKNDLLEALQQQPDYRLTDVAYSLRVGRTAHPYRSTVAVGSIEALQTAWSGPVKKTPTKVIGESAVIFMFPGQGSQYVGAAAQLYNAEPRFAANFDHCALLFEQHMDIDLRLFVGSNGPVSSSVGEQINNTHIAQALLFCYSYSLGKLLLDMGIKPDAMIGHSIGEYTAATLCGVMSVAQAVEIIALRGRLMNSAAPGHMVSVALTEAELAPVMAQTGAELAVVNAKGRCVLAVSVDNYEGLCTKLKADNIDHTLLHTSHAYHSSMMTPVVDEFVQGVNRHTFEAPQIVFVSNVTGQYADDAVCRSEYWGEHLTSTVRFGDGLATLLTDNAQHSPILWEIGPGTTLSMLARQQPAAKGAVILSSIPHVTDATDARHLNFLPNKNHTEFYYNCF